MLDPVSDHEIEHMSQMDPTGQVYLDDPDMVKNAIGAILEKLYGQRYDEALLSSSINDLVAAYHGNYRGLIRCDTLYHDLRHALETGLTTARLIDGHVKEGGEPLDADHAMLLVLLALFHDIGLLRRDTEGHLYGPVLIPVHEERGVAFMQDYLSRTSLAGWSEKSVLIMATKLVFVLPENWSSLDARLAGMLASADLLCQLADRCYLEKCRDFLFVEFSAMGIAGKTDSLYPDRETLLAKTPDFYSKIIRRRLDVDFKGVHKLIELHTGGTNPWEDAIKRNLVFLENMLSQKDFSRLQRHPKSVI